MARATSTFRANTIASHFSLHFSRNASVGSVANAGSTFASSSSSSPGDRSFDRLLRALALVDSMLLLRLVFETAVIQTFMEEPPHWYKLAYPTVVHPLKGFFSTASIYMVVAVAAERYKAICYPLR